MPAPREVHRRRAVDRSAPLRQGLLRIVAVLAVVVLGAGVLLGLTVAELRSAQDDAQRRLLPAVTDAQQLLGLFVDQETGERGFVITGAPEFLQPYEVATAALPGVQQDLQRHVSGLPRAQAAVRRVLSTHETWLTETARPEIELAGVDRAQAQQRVQNGGGRLRFDALRAVTQELLDLLSRNQARANDRIQTLTNRLSALLLGTLVVLALLLTALYPALLRMVVRPLRAFADAAGAAGLDLSVPVAVRGPAEVVTAAREVEGMRRRLVEQVRAARQAEQALAQGGPAVLALRDALAPGTVQVPGLELASRLDPAEGFLAGDWFDAVPLPGGRLGLVLGDVAGHGPGPAVFALRLKHLLSAALVSGRTAGEALTATARQLGETGELFATVFVAVVDVPADRVSYANAGHPAALVFRPADPPPGATGTPWADLPATGPLLSSLTASWSWVTLDVELRSGDLLVAYTDGLVEARDGAGRQYGSERLVAHLAEGPRAPAGRPDTDLARVLAGLVDDVAAHTGGPLGDDITLMACRRS